MALTAARFSTVTKVAECQFRMPGKGKNYMTQPARLVAPVADSRRPTSTTFVPMHLEVAAPRPTCSGTLLVVGSNPPTTSGQRTLARAEQARHILDFDYCELVNLFSLPTYRTSGLAVAGISPDGWLDARTHLAVALGRASAVLLAYGISKPSGAAAKHHDAQVLWLESEITRRGLPVWWVGGAPRHPSRWHRYTHRTHPETAFPEALTTALARRAPSE